VTNLAIDGGQPVRSDPFPEWPRFENADAEAAAAVVRSGKVNYWTGDEGRKFEQEFAAYADTKHAITVANGTVALELALHALGIGRGDEVITPCRAFVSSASCIAVRGAMPVMADIDCRSQTITAETIREVITPRTKAIIAVHLAGWPCEMDSIMDLAAEHNLKVIEDCAQAHGARYQGRPVGSLGHVGAFSFCQDKIMSTGGEGGMLTANDDEAWGRAWSYRDHGKSHEAVHERGHSPGYQWIYESSGTNWRLTEMQSALGRRLLSRLDASVERRTELAGKLEDGFAAIPALRTTPPPEHVRHAYYRFYAFVRPERVRPGWDRDRIMAAIQAEGIPCYVGSCPEIYREQAFAAIRPPQRLKVAQELGETSLAFLVHPTLSDSDIDDAIAAVRKVMGHASA
jgi:hypothetical protein